MADVKLEASDRITGPLGFRRSSVTDQWRHRCVDHNAADRDPALRHSWVLEDWEESGMSEELSAKAKAALLKLNERAVSDHNLSWLSGTSKRNWNSASWFRRRHTVDA